MPWTTPATWASGDWNIQIRDNIDYVYRVVCPIGAVIMYANSPASPPEGWLFCRGQSYSTSGTYSALFLAIGYQYGGSGGNFNVPDCQGRFPKKPGASDVANDGQGRGSGTYRHVHGVGSYAFGVEDAAASNVNTGGDHNHTHVSALGTHDHGFVASGNKNAAAGTATNVAAPSHLHGHVASNQAHDHGWNNHPGHQHGIPAHGHTARTATGSSAQNDASDNFQPPWIGFEFIIRYV